MDVGAVGGLGLRVGVPGLWGGGEVGVVGWDAAVVGPVVYEADDQFYTVGGG